MNGDGNNSVIMHCPDSMRVHIKRIMEGEYNLAYEHSSPVILDIGANIGGFALWALRRWPNSYIHCYEPLLDNFNFLQTNLQQFSGRFSSYNIAIGNPIHNKLFIGRHNCGECSLFNLGEQRSNFVNITTKHPNVLPIAQILKLDVEGAEVEVLKELNIKFDVIILEYHSDSIRRTVDSLLPDYILVGCGSRWGNRGVLKYLHNSIIEHHPKLIWSTE